MDARRSFRPYEEEPADGRFAARRDLSIWLITSLSLALIPFVIVAVAFRAVYADHGHHSFPSFDMLFGKGELLLVIVSVTGATLAELWRNPRHMMNPAKSAGLIISVVISLAAGALFIVIVYGSLTENVDGVDHSFVTTLSLVLLVLVVLIQSITLLTRPGTNRQAEQ